MLQCLCTMPNCLVEIHTLKVRDRGIKGFRPQCCGGKSFASFCMPISWRTRTFLSYKSARLLYEGFTNMTTKEQKCGKTRDLSFIFGINFIYILCICNRSGINTQLYNAKRQESWQTHSTKSANDTFVIKVRISSNITHARKALKSEKQNKTKKNNITNSFRLNN